MSLIISGYNWKTWIWTTIRLNSTITDGASEVCGMAHLVTALDLVPEKEGIPSLSCGFKYFQIIKL